MVRIPDHAMRSMYINKYVKARTEYGDTETLQSRMGHINYSAL